MHSKVRKSIAPFAAGLLVGAVTLSGVASAQSLGGFPIREPQSASAGGSNSQSASKKKGAYHIVVDKHAPGAYRTISSALNDIAEGGTIHVKHGLYEEAISIKKSVFIEGDRGPGRGVEIKAPVNSHCLSFKPKDSTAHAVVSNVHFVSHMNSSASACVDVHTGVFTLKESDVLGSGLRPAVKVSGGMVFLDKNRISAGSQGIVVEQAHSMMQTVITDNKILQNKVGVDIASGSESDVLISGNEIFDNLDTGIKSSGYGSAKMIGNKIRNNKGSGVILDKYAKLSLVRFNEIVQNSGDGVAIPFGVNGVIEDNNIVGNDGLSIFVRDGLEPKITNNVIKNNLGDNCSKRDRKKGRC